MTNERVRANGPSVSRRTLLTTLPASGVALTLPNVAAAQIDPAILAIIHELEDWQGWERSGVVAAKAYAAYRLREALGLDLPDPEHARRHLEFQGQSFEDYRRSYQYQRDCQEGAILKAPLPASSIGG